MCPKYEILANVNFCLPFLSLSYVDICWCFFYVTMPHSRSVVNIFWNMSINSSNISKVDNLAICSLNVRGLSNDVKRRETFNWLRNKKHSVYFLQEVHSSNETEKLWLAEWGYIVFQSLFWLHSSSKTSTLGLRPRSSFQFFFQVLLFVVFFCFFFLFSCVLFFSLRPAIILYAYIMCTFFCYYC